MKIGIKRTKHNPLFPQVQRRVRPLQRNFLTDKFKEMKTQIITIEAASKGLDSHKMIDGRLHRIDSIETGVELVKVTYYDCDTNLIVND